MVRKYETNDIVYVTVEALIGVLAIVCNIALMAALWKYRRMRTLTTRIVTNLAFAGLFAGLVTPVMVALPAACLPNTFYSCVLVIGMDNTTSNIVLISLALVVIERYCHMLHGVYYQRWATTCRIWGVLALAWALAVLVGMIPFVWHKDPQTYQNCSRYNVLDDNYSAYLEFFAFLLPITILLVVLFVHVLQSFQRTLPIRRRSHVLSMKISSETTLHRKEMFLFRRLMVLSFLLTLTIVPLHIAEVIRLWASAEVATDEVLRFLETVTHVSYFLSPLVYSYNRREFHVIAVSVWPLHRREMGPTASLMFNPPRPKSPTTGFSHAL
ncbi:hypothetical protein ACOMHN_023231 [Nucella lapillus]